MQNPKMCVKSIPLCRRHWLMWWKRPWIKRLNAAIRRLLIWHRISSVLWRNPMAPGWADCRIRKRWPEKKKAAKAEKAPAKTAEKKTAESIVVKDVLIEQGSNIKAEEDAEKKQEENITENSKTENSLTKMDGYIPQHIHKIEENTSKDIEKQSVEKEIVKVNQFTPQTTSQNENEKPKGWGVQVGAFSTKETAYLQAEKALKFLNIRNKQILTPSNNTFYRSRIYGFYSKKAAQNVCRKLKRKKMDCMVLPKEN